MASAGCWGCPATPAGGRPVGGPVASPGKDGQLPPILRAHGRQCCGGVWLCSRPPWPGCGPRVDQVSPPSPGPGPRAPGPRAAPRPRAISAGKSVRAVASPCPPPRHDGPRPPTAWAAEQPQACPPEAGRVGPQQEACRVRAGGSGCLGCCRHCSPCPNPASGGAAPPNLAAGLLGAPWSGGVTGILKDTEQEPPGL